VSTDAQSDRTPEARPKSHLRQTAAIVVVAAAIAGAGGAAIYAATDQPTDGRHGPWHPPGGPGGPGAPGGSAWGPKPSGNAGPNAGLNALPDQSLHGEFVTRDDVGGYRTVLVQVGTITAISPRSITIRSADSYTRTYLIPAAAAQSAPPFAVDQRVTVRATRDGQVATVTNIGFAEPPSR
jgi:hypothetical protein